MSLYPAGLPKNRYKKHLSLQNKNISKTGYGIWAKYHVFIIKNGDIVPVKYPDTQKLSDFPVTSASAAR